MEGLSSLVIPGWSRQIDIVPKLILTSKERDPVRLAAWGLATIAALTFLGSMIAVLFMHRP
jgi:hypothetical protein